MGGTSAETPTKNILVAGTGSRIEEGALVSSMLLDVWLAFNGVLFDSSERRGAPLEFTVGSGVTR
ncbi:hypothetical protein HK096_001587 [Nowakowskiella sp. JEL0078]|nr:hypothetical protein HK096_001587 [Nowakowskiella sp. JEL0078]